MKILQCVPNFSEGRDPNFLKELEAVLKQFPVKVLDLSMDKDHNRADSTFLGAPDAVEAVYKQVMESAPARAGAPKLPEPPHPNPPAQQ
jgi:glutamate formiminotransferase